MKKQLIYQNGMLEINLEALRTKQTFVTSDEALSLSKCEVGLQTEPDGRIWVCVNGMTILRFKPTHNGE